MQSFLKEISVLVGTEDYPKGVYYCDQLPGDVIYIPRNWWHATHNDGLSVGMGCQKTDDEEDLSYDEMNASLPELEAAAPSLTAKDTTASTGVRNLVRVAADLP